jgi:hypothetical protein
MEFQTNPIKSYKSLYNYIVGYVVQLNVIMSCAALYNYTYLN